MTAITQTKRHPKALPFLFLTEMWERFGFYVVQGLLVLFMTKAYGFSDDKSFTILGVFSALAYIAPMPGGFIADRLLGFRQAVIWGGILLSIGYALLALPLPNVFYLALATIIVGNGLFKPNISTLLGFLYKPGDTAREVGFTVFYMGINLGVLLSGISGTIKDHYGWHASFALASFGLLIGLGIFLAGLKWGEISYTSDLSLAKKSRFFAKPWILFYCLLTIGLLNILLQSSYFGTWLLTVVGIALLIFVFVLAFMQNPDERNRLITLNILIISSIVFWMIFLQMFFSNNLFIDRLLDKTFFGITISTTWFYSLESIFVMLLGPVLAWRWQTLNETNRNPSSFLKFIFAIIFAGGGFLILAISTFFPDKTGLISALWIIPSYLMITIGEMLLSPIGLAAVTFLSPPRLAGMMMGIWFVALGFGGKFAGQLAQLASVPKSATTVAMQLAIYRTAFFEFAGIAFAVSLLLFLTQWFLRKKWDVFH